MKNILLFGESGFLGTQLKKNLSRNIMPISLREQNWICFLPKDADVFINCIGKAHDHKGTATYEDYHFANVEILQQIFKAFIKSEAQLLIHISSIAAQQELESIAPLRETDACLPISHYGKTKREAEKWLLNQQLPLDKKLIILRPPMIHGPRDRGNLGLLYNLISKGVPYPFASFDNRRSFLSIENFTFYIENIIENYDLLESGIYNLADDEPLSTLQIINLISGITGKKPIRIKLPKKIVASVAHLGDRFHLPLNSIRMKKLTSNLLVSNQKIKTALQIEKLHITAEQGMIKTIQALRKRS